MPQHHAIAAKHLYILLYWAAAFGLWLLFTGTLQLWELAFGAGTSLLAAVGTEMALAAGVASFRPRVGWLLQALRLPWSILHDCVQIFSALARPQASILRSMVFEGGGDDAASAARRALAISYACTTPNSVVLDIDVPRRRLLVHHIHPAPTPAMLKELGARS